MKCELNNVPRERFCYDCEETTFEERCPKCGESTITKWEFNKELTTQFLVGLFPCADCGEKVSLSIEEVTAVGFPKLYHVGCLNCDIFGDEATSVQQAINNWDEARQKEAGFWEDLYSNERPTVN